MMEVNVMNLRKEVGEIVEPVVGVVVVVAVEVEVEVAIIQEKT
jgi:hypothetical protein